MDMARSVIITTPTLTLDEIVQTYGLSKADQKFVNSLFEKKDRPRSAAYAFKTLVNPSDAVKIVTKKSSNATRKIKSRARKAA